MRRKLNVPPSSSPLEPAAAPEPAASVATPEPESSHPLALPSHLLGDGAKFLPPSDADETAAPGTEDLVSYAPRIGFVSGREQTEQAALISSSLGNVPAGTAYVQRGRTYMRPLGKSPVILLDYLYYAGAKRWDDAEGRYEWVAAYSTPQKDGAGRDRTVDGMRISDTLLTLCLVLGEGDDAFVGATVQTFDGPRYSAGARLLGAIQRSTSPEFARRHGETVAALLPQFRVVGEIYGSKPAGRRYVKASCVARPISPAEFERFVSWQQLDEAQQQLAEAREHFDREAAAIAELIGE